MKKYLSIWMLFARSTLPKLLLVLAGFGVVQSLFFSAAVSPGLTLYEILFNIPFGPLFAVFFLLWVLVLSFPGFDRAEYTLARLRVNRWQLVLSYWIYATLCCFLFVGALTLLLLGLFRWYAGREGALFGPQTLLVLAYRNAFLHTLLPLEDWSLLVRNLCMLLTSGGLCAVSALRRQNDSSQRHFLVFTAVSALIWAFFFPLNTEPGNFTGNLLLSISALLLLAPLLYSAMRKEAVSDERTEEA